MCIHCTSNFLCLQAWGTPFLWRGSAVHSSSHIITMSMEKIVCIDGHLWSMLLGRAPNLSIFNSMLRRCIADDIPTSIRHIQTQIQHAIVIGMIGNQHRGELPPITCSCSWSCLFLWRCFLWGLDRYPWVGTWARNLFASMVSCDFRAAGQLFVLYWWLLGWTCLAKVTKQKWLIWENKCPHLLEQMRA